MSPTLIFLIVGVFIVWAHYRFVSHKSSVYRLGRLVTHPTIVNNIKDLETVINIKHVSDQEHNRLAYIWVPLGYLAMIHLGILWYLVDSSIDVPTVLGALAALTISGLLTAAIRYDFAPAWLVASAVIVHAASTKADTQTKEDLITQILSLPDNKKHIND
jgi:hypothetical protein